MQNYDEVELSALGMGNNVICSLLFHHLPPALFKVFFLMKNCSKLSVSSLVAAIGTVVTVAEILKNNGLATEKSKGWPWL